MQLIDTYRKMEKREILDCRMKSMKEAVRHYGLNLNSYEVFLLSEAYTFHYNTIQIPGVSLEAIPYATASHNDVEKTLFQNLNIPFHQENIAGDHRGWEQLKTLIDQGTPVLFRIDSRFLKEAEDAAPKQMKLNLYYLSTLLLVGYDEQKGVVWVVLTNDDEKEEATEIAIDDFQKYRSSVCAPFSPEGLCFYLKPESRIGEISREDIKSALFRSLSKITDIMLNKGEIYTMEIGSFIGSVVSKGIYGMRKLKEDMQWMLAHCQKNENPLWIRLMMVFLRNNLMFGSYSAFREEFGQCIKYVAREYHIDGLDKVGNDFGAIAHYWKTMFTLLSCIAHNKGDLIDQIQKLIQVWETIIESEHEQFANIRCSLAAFKKNRRWRNA